MTPSASIISVRHESTPFAKMMSQEKKLKRRTLKKNTVVCFLKKFLASATI
jgi:hypothetical protein